VKHLRTITDMQPGECRWVGRQDLHVYCHGSEVDGKYRPDVRVYKLWTIDSIGSVWDAAGWATAAEVATLVAKETANDR